MVVVRKLFMGTVSTILVALTVNSDFKAIVASLIGAFIIGLLLLISIVNYKNFKKIVYRFVVLAEYYITGNQKGQERFDYVVKVVRDYIPYQLRFILTEKRIKDIIEWAVKEMKKALGRGINVFDDVEIKKEK